MPEELPFIELRMDDEVFVATPRNAELFTFAGRSVLETGEVIDNETRNHVFLKTGKLEGDVQKGTYIFKPENVQDMGAVMLRNGFPAKLYQRTIHPNDERAYQRYVDQNLEEASDFFPEEWTEDGKES